MFATSFFGCSDTSGAPCSAPSSINRLGDSFNVEVCVDSVRATLVSIPDSGATISILIDNHADLVAVIVLRDLDGNPKSVESTLYDRSTQNGLFSIRSTNIPTLTDYNGDNVQELIFYGQTVEFQSLALTDIGVPTIVELHPVPKLGHLSDYPDLRLSLIEAAAKHAETLTDACTFDGEFDSNCAAVTDIENLHNLRGLLLRISQHQ